MYADPGTDPDGAARQTIQQSNSAWSQLDVIGGCRSWLDLEEYMSLGRSNRSGWSSVTFIIHTSLNIPLSRANNTAVCARNKYQLYIYLSEFICLKLLLAGNCFVFMMATTIALPRNSCVRQ